MTGITHRLAGAVAAMALIRGLQAEDPCVQAVLLSGCILGSLIPDIVLCPAQVAENAEYSVRNILFVIPIAFHFLYFEYLIAGLFA